MTAWAQVSLVPRPYIRPGNEARAQVGVDFDPNLFPSSDVGITLLRM